MMCEECGKRPARMAVTMITSGKATTRRLCPQCAAHLQRGDAQSVQTALLSALAGDNPPALTCPCCGRTTEQFLHTGRCPRCPDPADRAQSAHGAAPAPSAVPLNR